MSCQDWFLASVFSGVTAAAAAAGVAEGPAHVSGETTGCFLAVGCTGPCTQKAPTRG